MEIARWADEHRLPMVDNHVEFPDLRIEYEGRDGRREIEDVEVMTPQLSGQSSTETFHHGWPAAGFAVVSQSAPRASSGKA